MYASTHIEVEVHARAAGILAQVALGVCLIDGTHHCQTLGHKLTPAGNRRRTDMTWGARGCRTAEVGHAAEWVMGNGPWGLPICIVHKGKMIMQHCLGHKAMHTIHGVPCGSPT